MSMTEIMTAVRHQIPVTAVVFHNRQWGAEKKNQVDFYGRRFVAGEIEKKEFFAVARGMGAGAIFVGKKKKNGTTLQKTGEPPVNHGKTHVIQDICPPRPGGSFPRGA